MSWNSLKKVPEALQTVTDRVYHFDASGAEAPYIVWGEDSTERQEHADNRMVRRSLSGTVDYFTHNTQDDTMQRIEDALTEAAIPFRFESCQYEDDTKLCHYEWSVSIG